ncbi:MAG: GIY-YIG nuclease family protein [Candidatus Thorarchaeota archaeon]|nr:GIY-YIG nuclease family protein [Candidatus Thorarchaeota archaeon]
MQGVYTLIIEVTNPLNLAAGGLRDLTLEKGTYVYVGSAMGTGSTNLENRLARHFSEKKTVHWHIDYLLKKDVEKKSAVWAETEKSRECDVALRIKMSNHFANGPSGFGASDCKKKCGTHLFRQISKKSTPKILEEIFEQFGLTPHIGTKDNFR